MSSASEVPRERCANGRTGGDTDGSEAGAHALQGIADAAVVIADVEGIAAVSMQRVAAEFAYTKMSLYRYVTSKDELIAAMIDRAVGDPPVLDSVPGWLLRGSRPGRDRSPRPGNAIPGCRWRRWAIRVMGPNEIGWIERAIDTLADTLLVPSEQMAVVLLICGHIRNTQSAATAGTQPWSGVGNAVPDVHGDELPALERVLDAATDDTSDRGRAFGLTCILGGVEAILAERTPRPRARTAAKKAAKP